jgi:hypothetical protein
MPALPAAGRLSSDRPVADPYAGRVIWTRYKLLFINELRIAVKHIIKIIFWYKIQ